MTTHPRRASYGIFVRFRRSRLTLRRGIATLADAIALAEELRAGRFHDQGDVFLVKEPEGTEIELPIAAPSQAAPPQAAPPPAAPIPVASSRPPPARPDLQRILLLGEQIGQVRRALARALAAQERLVQALAAAEGAVRAHGASAPSEAFRSNQVRLGALVASGARAVASFEGLGVLLEQRLERAWAEATGAPVLVPAPAVPVLDGISPATRIARR